MSRALATPGQAAKWRKLQRLASDVSARLDLLSAYGDNEIGAYLFWSPRSPGLPDPRPLSQEVSNIQAGFRQTLDAIDKVDAGVFGLQFRDDGDINIVDPRPDDLSGWPWVVAGVVIVAGLAWGLYERDKSARTITKRFNALSGATDRMFCEQSTPETCAEWKAWKIESGYGEQKSALDSAIDSIGRAGTIGAKWGLIVGLPLAIYMVSQWLQKKR
jgi:hypothetical protein